MATLFSFCVHKVTYFLNKIPLHYTHTHTHICIYINNLIFESQSLAGNAWKQESSKVIANECLLLTLIGSCLPLIMFWISSLENSVVIIMGTNSNPVINTSTCTLQANNSQIKSCYDMKISRFGFQKSQQIQVQPHNICGK